MQRGFAPFSRDSKLRLSGWMPVLAALCLREGDRMLGSFLVLAGGGARAALASAFCAGPCAAELAVPSACPLQEVRGSHCRAAFSTKSPPCAICHQLGHTLPMKV